MSCFRKNNDQKGFVVVMVIMAVLFMIPTSIMASHRGNGTKIGKMNPPSDRSGNASYGVNGLKKAFDRLDINSDGCLTMADYKPDRSKLALLAIIPCYRGMIPALVLESREKWYTYAGLDTNGDGQVDFNEFIVPRTKPYQRVHPN